MLYDLKYIFMWLYFEIDPNAYNVIGIDCETSNLFSG